MQRSEILKWLREDDPARLAELWERADSTRRECVGDAIFLRALIELSNHCRRTCHYCGLRAPNHALLRYRMNLDEIMTCVRQAAGLGLGTVVLQAGEDPGLSLRFITGVIRTIKRETAMAVTLSLGERSEAELVAWHLAGADRYLLRFETSNSELFNHIHPRTMGVMHDRMGLLHALRRLDYELGSGVMVGIPGQTYEDLAGDIELFRTLDLDMIGVGPFIPHPQTPLGHAAGAGDGVQAPATVEMTCKVVALARLVCPQANIPSTTALASLDPAHGRELALRRGANIVMPNFTPVAYRESYMIYPGKPCVREEAETCLHDLERRILAMGRTLGTGRGDSPHRLKRTADLPALEGAAHG